MSKTKKSNEISLEELLAQTEEKITNKEYYEDVIVEYKGMNVGVRIRPISQARFTKILKNKDHLDFTTDIIHECVLNKFDNKPFTKEQINKLFTGGLAGAIATECCNVSGIITDMSKLKEVKLF